MLLFSGSMMKSFLYWFRCFGYCLERHICRLRYKILQKKRTGLLNIIKYIFGAAPDATLDTGDARYECPSWRGNAQDNTIGVMQSGFTAVFFSLIYLLYLRCS